MTLQILQILLVSIRYIIVIKIKSQDYKDATSINARHPNEQVSDSAVLLTIFEQKVTEPLESSSY